MRVTHRSYCHHDGCTKGASFGVDGSKEAELCCEHKRDGTVDLSKKCLYDGCTKVPSFGVDGSKNVVFCSEHKKDEVVNVVRKRCGLDWRGPSTCGHDGCAMQPSCVEVGSIAEEPCVEHTGDGMMLRKKCGEYGCKNRQPWRE